MKCHEETLVLHPGPHDPGGLRLQVPDEEHQPVPVCKFNMMGIRSILHQISFIVDVMPVVLRDGVAVHVAVGVHDLQAVVPRVGDAVHADLGGGIR